MLQFKKDEVGVERFDNKINAWDFQYYHRVLLEKQYNVNEEEIKEYFPTPRVISETLAIYQEILNLVFTQVIGAKVWHPDVTLYEVTDKITKEKLGEFYLDLHPRDGKYTHAAVFPLQPDCLLPNGKRQTSVNAMLCNFSKPSGTGDKPSLLRHGEFVTFFHEFGHVMHGICSQVNISRFAGTRVFRDFVEAPSQMLENWCWEKDILRRVSKHYKTEQPLPDTLIDGMVAAKNANSGLLNLRQVFYGVFDQEIHTQPKINSAEIFGRLKKEITLTENTPGTNGAASFGHMVGGYDASYYGYLWSEVFSADMYSVFKKNGIMSLDIGKQYRNKILQPGGSIDADIILRDFLGREPNQDAFLEHIGLTATKH